jgi:hypothetical protein
MLARTLLALSVFLASSAIEARDNGQYTQVSPEVGKWVESLTDSRGVGCCATADGFRPEEVEWDTSDNSYRVRIDGRWFTVPENALIKEPNRIGFAIVWYYVDGSTLHIRCFLPGSGA